MRKRKIKMKILFSFIIIIIFLGLFIFSGFKIANYLKDNHNNKVIQEELLKNAINVIEQDDEEKKEYSVDFQSLKQQNADTVAYLKVNGTNIDYIVVQGKDNNYYLEHNFNHDWNVSGWIFADYRNDFSVLDKNIVIYGHNTRDGSMFGTLKNVLNDEWQKNKDNGQIIFVTEKDTYYYQVFAVYTIDPEDYYIKTSFASDMEFEEFIHKIKSRSIVNYFVDITKEDSLLTLSSCTSNGTKRVVLHAKLINNTL